MALYRKRCVCQNFGDVRDFPYVRSQVRLSLILESLHTAMLYSQQGC
jgi:hypothetical protein